MEDIKFLLDFSDSNSLDRIIQGLEKVDSKYKELQNNISKNQKELFVTDDSKRVAVLVAEIDKLKREYAELSVETQKASNEKKKNAQLTDEQVKAQVREKNAINELRKAERELIKDETALQLAQKKSVNSIKDLREQTNALVRMRDKLDMSTKEGKKQFDDYTKKIANNTNELKKYDEQIGRYQRNVGNYGSAFKSFGTQLLGAGGITLGLTGVFQGVNAATDAFKEFDGQLQEVSAITGLTGSDLDFFKKKAYEVGTTTRTSADDYLNAVKIIGSAKPELLSNKEALDQVTQAAITLSDASGMQLPDAATALTDAMNQFGASADQAGKFIDVLAAGAKYGSAEVPQITEALLKFGAVANSANVQLDESVALVEALAEKGLKGAEAGTALRNVMLKLSAPDALPKEAKERLDKLGISFKDLTDKSKPFSERLKLLKPALKDTATMVKIFGTENVVAATNLIKSTDRIKELTKQVNENGVAMEQANTNNKSAAAQSEILNNKMHTLAIQIGEKLTPVVNFLKEAFNAVLYVVLKLIEGIEYLGEKFQDLTDWMGGGVTAIADEYVGNLNKIAEKDKKLSESIIKTNVSFNERREAAKALAGVYRALDTATEQTRKEGEKLIESFSNGKITIMQLKNSLVELYQTEQLRRSKGAMALKAGIKNAKEEIKTDEQLAEEKIKLNKELDKEYENKLKRLDNEKKTREIGAEKEIEDEKAKSEELKKINIDYLSQKEILDKQYNKDYLSTELERLRAELDLRKKHEEEKKKLRDEEIARAKAMSDMEYDLMAEGQEKEIMAQYITLVDKIDQAQKAGILTQELETKLAEQTEQKIFEIKKKYADQAVEDKLKLYDEYYKELELAALQSGKKKEDIDLMLRKAEIEHLKDEIKLREEAGQDVLDLQIELAQKELDLIDETEQKKKEKIQKGIDETVKGINIVTAAYDQAIQKRIDQQQKELDAQKDNVSRQEELAANGMENTLAFEKQMQAEKEKQLLISQKKQEKAKKIEAFFNALAEFSKDDPATAPAKAFLEVQLAELFASKFEDGGIISDVVNRDGLGGKISNGIFKGRRHRQGGILIEAEGDEGIFSRKEMGNLGRGNFYALKDALKTPNGLNHFIKQNEELNNYSPYMVNKIDLSPIQKELRDLKQAIEEKPVASMQVDNLMNIITKLQSKSKTHYKVTKKRF